MSLKVRFLKLLEDDIAYNKKYHQWRTREIEISLEDLISNASKIVSESSVTICMTL